MTIAMSENWSAVSFSGGDMQKQRFETFEEYIQLRGT